MTTTLVSKRLSGNNQPQLREFLAGDSARKQSLQTQSSFIQRKDEGKARLNSISSMDQNTNANCDRRSRSSDVEIRQPQ